jgi:thioredoxin reductase (NADPH)
MTDFEVVVVGGGIAALTAGMVSARRGRSTVVLMPMMPGGHLMNVERIDDFPGFPEGIAGFDLGPLVQEQAAKFGCDFRMEEAEKVERAGDAWSVKTAASEYSANAVIVATGSALAPLGVPGEHELTGRGVSHCGTCDGPLMRGQRVCVVGGGDSALQEALTLAAFASEVVVIHRGDEPVAQAAYREACAEQSKITFRANSEVTAIVGIDAVSGVTVRDGAGVESDVDVAGVFVFVGLVPNTACLADAVSLDADGRVPTDIWMRTSARGLLAAGDIRRDSASQAITAAGDGATAAVAAHRYLARPKFGHEWPTS